MISQSGNTAIDKTSGKKSTLSKLWDVFVYGLFVVLDAATVAFGTGQFDGSKMLDAFMSPNFWAFEIVKIIGIIMLRYFYVPQGLKKHRDNTKMYFEDIKTLFQFRDKMLSDRRLDEFGIFLSREVDRVDKLNKYRKILDQQVIDLEKKPKLKPSEKEFIPKLRKKQEWAADLATAYKYRDIVRIRRLEKEWSIDNIDVPGRTTITADILFSNFSEEQNKDELGLAYNSDEAIKKSIWADVTVIAAITITLGVALASWANGNKTWQQILAQAVITTGTFFMAAFTAFKRGVTVGKNEIIVIENRIHVVNDFNMQPAGFFTNLYREEDTNEPKV